MIYDYNDYIKLDCVEEELKAKGDYMELESVQMRNRGIIQAEKGGYTYDSRQFATYCITKRISVVIVENEGRYVYNHKRGIYERMAEIVFTTLLMEILDEYDSALYKNRKEQDVISYIDKLIVTFKERPENNRYIIMRNGVYDLKRFKFTDEFSEKIFSTYALDYSYDEGVECDKFLAFLKDIFNDDNELITAIQEMFAYTFCYGEAPCDCFYFLYSAGRSGKSVLCNILKKLHGENRVSGLSLAGLEERFQLAAIADKVVNISSENTKSKLMESGRLKAITGRDTIVIEEKYKEPKSMQIYTKLVIVSNHYLTINDESNGLWQRIRAIPFPNTYLPKPINGVMRQNVKYQIPNLEQMLLEEISGIFNWVINGLIRLRKNNYVFFEAKAMNVFKNQLMLFNKPVDVFIEYCIQETIETNNILSADMHKAFKVWADTNEIDCGDYIDARKFHGEFKNCLNARGIEYEYKKNNVYRYYGVGLVNNYKEQVPAC